MHVYTLTHSQPDEIQHLNSSAALQRIIGGAGTYAALGARLAAGRTHADAVGWIVDKGSDFPSDFKDLIETWGTRCVFRFDAARLTTRAWNGYGENEYRGESFFASIVSDCHEHASFSCSFVSRLEIRWKDSS